MHLQRWARNSWREPLATISTKRCIDTARVYQSGFADYITLDQKAPMSQLCLEIVKGFFTLVAVVLGSYVGLCIYFRQKEYELVKQRYLEGGVDIVATQLETSLGVVSHNWARCLQVCKSFRDTGEDFDVKELDRGFLVLDNSKFQHVAHHRVSSLLQSQVIWDKFQSAMAYASSANSIITQEVPEAMRMRCTTNRTPRDHASMGQKMIEDLSRVHDKSFKFAVLVRELHALSLMLEQEKLNLKAIATFSQRVEVQQVIQRLTTQVPEASELGHAQNVV
jgi:hypothetical protein